MIIYPKNLKAKPMMWFWKMWDICVLAFTSILGLVLLIYLGWMLPLVCSIVYGICTMRIEDISISDYILHACVFFLSQQTFLWDRKNRKEGERNGKRKLRAS